MKPLQILLPAEQELFDAACYYELQAPSLGQNFLDKVEIALQEISSHPTRWPIISSGIRRRLIHRFPYALLYRVDSDYVVVLAIMHQKRHPEYWLSRVLLREK
jgi:plasmid stabilization system protein ParE